jgi:uncharacterized protein
MKQLLSILLFFSALTLLGQEFPQPMNPPRLVNDFAQALNSQQLGLLENKLRNYNDSTSNEIAVVIIGSAGAYDISQYGAELAEEWKVGKTKKDNGVLLLVAMDDRKVNISTGYGLEPVITDADSKRLIDNYILPNFRNGQYFEGIDQATSILMAMASGEFKADTNGEKSLGKPFLFVVFIIWLFWNISRFGNKRKRSYGSRPLNTMTSMWMLGGLNSNRGRGFDSFSSGSGSFGGFGGGSFGGGGASGSW